MYAAETARPYVGRALRDEEFRSNLRTAFAAARAIYDELGSQRGLQSVASRVATDADIQQNLGRAIAELRQAAERLQRAEREQAKSHTIRTVALILSGVVIGVLFNPFTGPETRRWVKSKVSGGDNGFGPSSSPRFGYDL
jgi:gas vesicle protein